MSMYLPAAVQQTALSGARIVRGVTLRLDRPENICIYLIKNEMSIKFSQCLSRINTYLHIYTALIVFQMRLLEISSTIVTPTWK